MKRLLAILALTACTQQLPPKPLEDLGGRWDVQQIAGASLGEGVDAWIEIDPQTGALRGFSGCNSFTAQVESFGERITIGTIVEADAACASDAAAVDETRLLRVLPSVTRYRRRERALEFMPAEDGAEALLLMRLEEAAR